MDAALSAVKAAVAACADQREACEAAAADASSNTCKDAFQACREQAISAALPDLSKGVSACAEQSQSCRKSAPEGGAAESCRDQLRQCVADAHEPAADLDASAPEADAGVGADHGAPVASCTSALRTCIEGDEPAKSCTDQLRVCLAATLPEHGRDHADAAKPEHERGSSADHKPAEAGVRGRSNDHDDGGDEALDEDDSADEDADGDADADEALDQDAAAEDNGGRAGPQK